MPRSRKQLACVFTGQEYIGIVGEYLHQCLLTRLASQPVDSGSSGSTSLTEKESIFLVLGPILRDWLLLLTLGIHDLYGAPTAIVNEQSEVLGV